MKKTRHDNTWRNRFSIHWSFLFVVIWFIAINIISDFQASGWIWSGIMLFTLFVSIFIHDMAQAITGFLFNMGVSRVILLPIGALPSISRKPSRKIYEIFMLASGPLANLIIAGILALYLQPYNAYWDEPRNVGSGYPGNFLFQLQFINLCLGLINLIPVFPMDAGRMLDAFLEYRVSRPKAVRTVNRISMGVAALLMAVGVIRMKVPLLLLGLFVIFTIPLGKCYHPLKRRETAASR